MKRTSNQKQEHASTSDASVKRTQDTRIRREIRRRARIETEISSSRDRRQSQRMRTYRAVERIAGPAVGQLAMRILRRYQQPREAIWSRALGSGMKEETRSRSAGTPSQGEAPNFHQSNCPSRQTAPPHKSQIDRKRARKNSDEQKQAKSQLQRNHLEHG